MSGVVEETPEAATRSLADTDDTGRRVAVVTDSTADLPADLVAAHNITVVPLVVTIGGATFVDGELSQEEFFARMKAAPRLPTTSQPAVGTFVEAYERALESASEVASIHISSALSGTIEAAHQAAERFGEKVRVLDSRTLSGGFGLQVIEAAKAAASGATLAGVARVFEQARDRANMIIGLDSLENLAKGGRIGKASAFLGGMLDLKVTLTVVDGSFQPVARARGTKAALRGALDWVEERLPKPPKARFWVLHAMAEPTALELRAAIQRRFAPIEPIPVVQTGSVIAAHTGSGWAVAFLPEAT